MTCRSLPYAPSGPPALTGRIARGIETELQGGIAGRCHALWACLYGGDCDFDDCWFEFATLLGWSPPPTPDEQGHDISSLLSSAGEYVVASTLSWRELRLLALEAFDRCRRDDEIPLDAYDGRTWDGVVTDTLYEAGRCRACMLGVPGTPREHRELAGWVLHGRTSWAQIAAVVHQAR